MLTDGEFPGFRFSSFCVFSTQLFRKKYYSERDVGFSFDEFLFLGLGKTGFFQSLSIFLRKTIQSFKFKKRKNRSCEEEKCFQSIVIGRYFLLLSMISICYCNIKNGIMGMGVSFRVHKISTFVFLS